MKRIIFMIILLGCHALSADCTGDCNFDGATDMLDALLCAQAQVGLIQLACDVTDDNDTNIIDALAIARMYVCLIDKLPCQQPIKYIIQSPIQITWNGVNSPDGYNVFTAYYDDNDILWSLAHLTNINSAILPLIPGLYIFAIQSKWIIDDNDLIASGLHTSIDDNAEPSRGWYCEVTE